MGCVIWYIGTGGARFQPYGLAVVCAVTWPFIFLYRVAAPPTVMVAIIILTVSIGLVVGYSIIDTFGGFTLANPGTGWEITWRRFLLVMIGLTASYLASFLPRPESARTKVRLTLAQCLDSLGDVYTEASLSFSSGIYLMSDVLLACQFCCPETTFQARHAYRTEFDHNKQQASCLCWSKNG